jgi:dienelactone hydrolase
MSLPPPTATAPNPPTHRFAGATRSSLVVAALGSVVGIELGVLAVTADRSAAGRTIGAAVVVALTAILLRGAMSGRPWIAGAARLTLGLLGLIAGLAIGPVTLATVGATPVAVIALLSLIAGSILTVMGMWALVRVTPGWWRLLALPVAFVILQFAVVPLAAAIYATHPPNTPTTAALPAGYEAVSITTADGVPLLGWYVPSHNGAAVVLLPGSGGEKSSTMAHAAVLARHGYGVLALDSRGTGGSGGVGNAWGWRGPEDVAGAVTWLQSRDEVDDARIGVVGLSMGAEIGLTAAAADDRIRAVVAEGATARVADDLAYLPADVTGVIRRIDAVVMFGAASLMTDAAPPPPLMDAIAEADLPVLLIVGDDPEEALAAERFARVAPSLSVWTNLDTPHMQALAVHPEAWEARVIGFLDSALADVSDAGVRAAG